MCANFYRCGDMIVDRLGAVPMVTTLPIGSEADFKGIVDLVRNRAIIWKDESLGAEFFYDEIPADLKEQAAEWRQKMIDMALEMDDAALEAYLEGRSEEHTSELQSLMRISYAVFCLKKKKKQKKPTLKK